MVSHLRFSILFEIEKREIPIDYRRKFISFLKKIFSDYDKTLYEKFYKDKDSIEKAYTFSVYLGLCQMAGDKIILKNDNIILNFSTYDTEIGLHFYNAALGSKYDKFNIGEDNFLTLKKVNLIREKVIKGNKAVFKTFSPVVIREHIRKGNRDKFYTLKDDAAVTVLKNNLKYQLKNVFDFDIEKDVDSIKIRDLNTKMAIVKNYEITVPCTLGVFEIEGENYLLDYFYKAGFSSKKSAGFGMLEIVE